MVKKLVNDGGSIMMIHQIAQASQNKQQPTTNNQNKPKPIKNPPKTNQNQQKPTKILKNQPVHDANPSVSPCQAMVHELLGMTNNMVDLKKVTGWAAGVEAMEVQALSSNNQWWYKSGIHGCGSAVNQPIIGIMTKDTMVKLAIIGQLIKHDG